MAEAKLHRMLRLLKLIPSQPQSVSTDLIKKKLEGEGDRSTMRTIQRDLWMLEGMGLGIECIDKSKPYRWRRLPTADDFFAPHVDPQTALALRVVETHLERMLPKSTMRVLTPYLQGARKALHGKPVEKWLDKVRLIPRSQQLLPPSVDGAIAGVVHEALLENRQIAAKYKKRGAVRAKDVVLHPAGLVYRDSVGTLLARADKYGDIYQYQLHRFVDAKLLPAKATLPPGFDLDAYIRDGELAFRIGDEIALELRLEDDVAVSLEETPLAPNQTLKPRPDGRVELRARVMDTLILRSWLLSFGARVEVVRPPALRRALATELRRAAGSYGAVARPRRARAATRLTRDV